MENQPPLVTITIHQVTAKILKAELETMLKDKERELPKLEGYAKSYENSLSQTRREIGVVKAAVGMIKNALQSLSKTIPPRTATRVPAR